MKKLLKIIACILAGILLLAAAGIGYLTLAEYRPEPRQQAESIALVQKGVPAPERFTVCTWNIGYGGLGKDSDFFMDGGKMVYPPSQQAVEENLAAITAYMKANPADVWLIQEADVDSDRSGGVNEFTLLQEALGYSGSFAYNYRCSFVPFPLPPLGQMASGLAAYTAFQMDLEAERVALHCPFSWPVRAANMKRCLLVERVPVEGSNRELVLVNLHLEAYESGEGRIAQTRELLALLEEEYAKGNYVIAGGDFNQAFPDSLAKYPIQDGASWAPGQLDAASLPENWQFAADLSSPTCRLLDAPYSVSSQLYVIDGFILSPNVAVEQVETVDLQFGHSDHNPVRLQVRLLP